MHFLLCDDIDSGKSAFCTGLVERLISRGAIVSGWITPAHMEGGEKQGHDFVAIDRGTIEPPLPFTRLVPFEGSFQFMRYHFNARAFERAGMMTERCFRVPGPGSRVPDIFVIDEIGPLELFEKRGFYGPMTRALDAYPETLTVVRKGLENGFQSAVGAYQFHIYSIDALRRQEFLILEGKSA